MLYRLALIDTVAFGASVSAMSPVFSSADQTRCVLVVSTCGEVVPCPGIVPTQSQVGPSVFSRAPHPHEAPFPERSSEVCAIDRFRLEHLRGILRLG